MRTVRKVKSQETLFSEWETYAVCTAISCKFAVNFIIARDVVLVFWSCDFSASKLVTNHKCKRQKVVGKFAFNKVEFACSQSVRITVKVENLALICSSGGNDNKLVRHGVVSGITCISV